MIVIATYSQRYSNIIKHKRSCFYIPRYSALAGERKLSAPAKVSSGDSRRQEVRSPISGGGRRGPFPAQVEREKALEAVRAVTQPKVCSSDSNAIFVKLIMKKKL